MMTLQLDSGISFITLIQIRGQGRASSSEHALGGGLSWS